MALFPYVSLLLFLLKQTSEVWDEPILHVNSQPLLDTYRTLTLLISLHQNTLTKLTPLPTVTSQSTGVFPTTHP